MKFKGERKNFLKTANFLCDNIWSEDFLFYNNTDFPRRIEIDVVVLKNICIFKFRGKVRRIKVKIKLVLL